MSGTNWHRYFFKLAELVSTKSKDQSTKVGAVIVGTDHEIISTGYNGMPRRVDDNKPERQLRPEKYDWMEHGERNAIYNAARRVLKGTTLYQMYASPPCVQCARGVIQAGIIRVVSPSFPPFPGKGQQWEEEFKKSRKMLEEAGVEYLEIPVGD